MSDPRYVDPWGINGSPQPFRGKDVHYYGFVVKADQDRLNAICDRHLTQPTGGKLRYIALVPYVLVVCANVTALHPTTAPYSDTFWSPEKEVDFTILAAAVRKEGPIEVIDHLAWFMPYMLVDSPVAIIAGREIYGFAKQFGWMDIPTDPDTATHFQADTLAVKEFSNDSELTRQTLLTIERTQKTDTPNTPLTDLRHAYQEAKNILFPDGEVLVPGFRFFISMLEGFVHQETTMAFLKQFPAASDGSKADYQAIVEAPMKMENMRRGMALTDHYDLTLTNYANWPVQKDMGIALTDGVAPSLFSFYFYLDFVIERGRTLWQTTLPPARGCLPSWLHW